MEGKAESTCSCTPPGPGTLGAPSAVPLAPSGQRCEKIAASPSAEL